MRALARLTRLFIFSTALLTLSSCCCCDPEVLGQFTDGVGEGFEQELEAKMKEEAAKVEAQMAAAEAEAAKLEAEAQKAAPAETEQPAADKPVEEAPAKAKAKGDLNGSFKDTKFDKKSLTGGSIKLEVEGKKISGRFLGQYYRKPFSIPLEGKLGADDSFELKGKHEDSEVVVKGSHTGDALDGKINGRVRGKAIDAKFAASRRK